MEAKYPALLFKQQLDAFVQKIFPMLRDNVKKEITSQLAACIHAPRTAITRSRRGGPATSPRASAGPPGVCNVATAVSVLWVLVCQQVAPGLACGLPGAHMQH